MGSNVHQRNGCITGIVPENVMGLAAWKSKCVQGAHLLGGVSTRVGLTTWPGMSMIVDARLPITDYCCCRPS